MTPPLATDLVKGPPRTILVTGGAGFIGSAVVRWLISNSPHRVVNVDALTYAGNLDSLQGVADDSRHTFEHVDIRDREEVRRVFIEHYPDAVLHLAAETHVDRSIDGPTDFVETNVLGTFALLEEARLHWNALDGESKDAFRFVHVSTDEVFGSLGPEGAFDESTPYDPSSPYSASKAGSDHLARAWYRTYGLPVLITSCSNNYGPYQFPEKLVPLLTLNALEARPLPVYGKGDQVRDWLHVDDHVAGLILALGRGQPGRTYLFGGDGQRENLKVVEYICAVLDELVGELATGPRRRLIEFVEDRPGHDQRYAVDSSTARDELGWTPRHTFQTGLRQTVEWYLEHRWWWERVRSGEYRGERLGLHAITEPERP